jgi:hypothetical protein
VTLTAPATNSYTNNTRPTFSGAAGQVAASSTTSADSTTATVNIYAGATATGTPVQTLMTTESGGSWSVAPTTALSANAQYTAKSFAERRRREHRHEQRQHVRDRHHSTERDADGACEQQLHEQHRANLLWCRRSGHGKHHSERRLDDGDGEDIRGRDHGRRVGADLTTTESGGSWSVAPTIALAANAQYTAHASQSDGAGNAGFSGTSTFVIDTMNPAVTLTAPANGATGVGLTPTFSGAAGQVAASSTTSADNTTVTVYLCTGSQTSCGSGSGSLIQTLSTVNTFTTGNDTFTVSNPGTQTAGTSFSVTITAKLPGATGPASCPARSARRPRT